MCNAVQYRLGSTTPLDDLLTVRDSQHTALYSCFVEVAAFYLGYSTFPYSTFPESVWYGLGRTKPLSDRLVIRDSQQVALY
jgi:hypothetical protein